MVQAIAFTIQNNSGTIVNVVRPDEVSFALNNGLVSDPQDLPGMYEVSPPGDYRPLLFTINFGGGALNIIPQSNNTAEAHFLVTTRLAPSV